MSKVYWIRHHTGKWHAVWANVDTGKSVCGRAKKRGSSWAQISQKPRSPTCESCKARRRDRVKN